MSALRKPEYETPTSEPTRLGSMSCLEHLEEFRRRIINACIGIAVGMCLAFVFIDRLMQFVLEPTRRMLPAGARLIYTNPGEAFSLYIYVALIAGTLLASPFVMYQLWRFIAPALYANEKRLVIPFVLLTTTGAVRTPLQFRRPRCCDFVSRLSSRLERNSSDAEKTDAAPATCNRWLPTSSAQTRGHTSRLRRFIDATRRSDEGSA